MQRILKLLQTLHHLVKAGIVGVFQHILSPTDILQDGLTHEGIFSPLLLAPCTLLGDDGTELFNGLGAELLRSAMGVDLDVRNVLLQVGT